MKKFLVVLLALAMVFAIATTAMAADKVIPDYNDTKTSTEYAVDIYRLTALGVLEGNTGWGGAYRPADNLTRAEFAKIACFMFGKQDYKDYYAAQKSAFSDVPEGHWAEGWINCANDNGLMIGVGSGKFAPEANVTKQEVATVTLRGVGYDDNLPGAWPADYIAKSQEVHTWFEDEYKDGESLFDYVQKIDGTAASRAEMAAIVNYCLDLYRVEYVGDQTMIAGISRMLGVDKDGYAYIGIEDTNEKPDQDILDVIANTLDGKTTLLWDVFNGVVYPEWQYATWGTRTPILVEAAGWGYEDFEEDELLFTQHRPYFKSRPTVNALTAKAPQDASEEQDASHTVSVASDYYIFDQYLDGELWQLGNRYANLTLIYNKKAVEKYEAVFAEMLSDVEYDEEANADVYTYEGNETEQKGDVEKPYLGDVYDYDWFAHLQFAIVDDVKKGDMATVDWFSPYGEKLNTGEFCLLDDCEKHDQLYVFLKDGKLQDASCLEVDDVVYNAGPLQYNYTKGFITRPEDVHLYIVTSPAKATLEKLTYSPKLKNGEDANENLIGCYSEYRDVRQVTIDGKDYWFCENSDNDVMAHQMALDGGYADDGEYEPMLYGDEEGIVGLYEKLTDEDDQILFAPAYAKTYAATIIFSAASENKQYGVLVDEDSDHVGHWYVDEIEFFGPDGKNTGMQALTDSVKIGTIASSPDDFPYDELIGTLTNYYLDDEDVIVDAKDVTGDDAPFNWLKWKAGKKDIGYIALTDKPDERVSIVTKDGKFDKTSAKAIDDATKAIIADESEKIGITALKDSTAEGKTITEDTIIFELKAKYSEDGTPKYSSVKLGDFENYENAEFTADEFVIFAWKDKDVKVLYVVNPSFAEPAQIGLFDVSQADTGKGFVEYVENGSKVYFTENQGRDLKTLDYVYAAYKTEDDKLSNVEDSGSYGDEVQTGDFVVLITENGWGINSSDAKAIIEDMLPADEVSDIIPYAQVENELKKYEVTDDTEFIDLTKGETFVIGDTDAIIHTDDAEKYGYILISDENYNLLQVVRVLVKQNNPETFQVTFDADGGEPVPEALTVNSGEKATAPTTDPAKDDYKFGGWVDDEGNAFDFDQAITADTTVKAAWAPWLYFYPNTGAENEKPWRSTAVAEGNSPTFTDQPTNGELTFLGWASSADATEAEFTDLSQIVSDGSPASYYAVWQEVTGD